ncbi:hypothetical protein KVV02_007218 [Mortierella alpina]|uniref:Uncharacterized protein n=1 Tax=Mortierella alpina TaxID=64518 RepID=A0A9P8A5G0_MORAP|nr:hypothetical protein KVV02_007218 [Mortierella alpina]
MQQHSAQGSSLDSTAKILVLGDSGVGKSSLVHALCHNEPLRSSVPTIGCNIDVRLHSSTIPSAAATSSARSTNPSLLSRANNISADPSAPLASGGSGLSEPTFIEFYDISGAPSVRHEKSRTMFYRDVPYQGILLVHDLCNRRSYDNLWKWIGDYLEASSSSSAPRWPSQQQDGLGFNGTTHQGARYGELGIPLLVVGTKTDMASSTYDQQRNRLATSFGQDLVDKYGGEAISVCSISPAEFMPNSSTMIAFNLFFNSIVDPRKTATASSSRSRNPSANSHQGAYAPASTSRYPRPPPTPTPGEDPHLQLQHRHHSQPHERPGASVEEKDEYGSSGIPIMDFATFTGGSTASHHSADPQHHHHHHHHHHPTAASYGRPPRSNPPFDQAGAAVPIARSVTPTGFSSTLSTKSALRAQYERNRSVLGQYNSHIGVPTYTNLSGKGNSSAGGNTSMK